MFLKKIVRWLFGVSTATPYRAELAPQPLENGKY